MENAITLSDKLKLIKFILSTNKFTNGIKVKDLESEWNKWLGAENSLFVSSGSTANFLLIASIKELYNLKSGDKVLVPACTWMTSVAPIIQLGLTPIFCDIQTTDFSFDPFELDYISKIHPDIKLIFVTHLLGFPSRARIDKTLSYLFPEALIIDDACESHGCTDNDKNKIGSNSLGATFSTYWGHHMCSQEGGFVSTNNPELYDLMRMKRSHGMARESKYYNDYAKLYPDIDPSFLFVTDGYNFRNIELNAVLGLSQVKRLDSFIKIRNNNYQMFTNVISCYQQIIEPIIFDYNASSFCLPIICKSKEIKDALQKELVDSNIEYRPIVSGNLLRHPFLKDYKICSNKKHFRVDTIHDLGLYIGNNQFVGKRHLKKLDDILEMVSVNYSRP